MTAEALVARLRAQGIELRVVGDKIRYRPVSALTAVDLEELRQWKAEVLVLLAARTPPLRLDPISIREVLGPAPAPHHVAMLKFDVMQAVAQLETEIQAGVIGTTALLVRGRPLADWLDLGDLARLLRAGKR